MAVTFPWGVVLSECWGIASECPRSGDAAALQLVRDLKVRSPFPVKVADVCRSRAPTPGIPSAVPFSMTELNSSSGLYAVACGAEISRLSEEDEVALLCSARPLVPDFGAKAEKWVKLEVFTASGKEVEFPVISVDVLSASNHCAVLFSSWVDCTELDTISVCSGRLLVSVLEFWARGCSLDAGESFG